MHAETPSLVLLVAAYMYKIVNLICASNNSGPMNKQFTAGQRSVGLHPEPDSRLCNSLSLSGFAHHSWNPNKHNLSTPPLPDPTKKWYTRTQVGGGGSKTKNSIAFGKSISQRIYSKQRTEKIRGEMT